MLNKKYRWTLAQEVMLKEQVESHRILVDPATSNNPKVRLAAWEEVTQNLNLTFGLTLERMQARKQERIGSAGPMVYSTVYPPYILNIFFFWGGG